MKKKPRVVSKKAKEAEANAPVWMRVQAKSTKDGIGTERPAALVDARGLGILDPNSAIGKVATTYGWGYAPRSGNPAAWSSTVVDGGSTLGVGKGAGGALNLAGTFIPGKIGQKGTVLKGKVNGYVTGSTGRFADAGLAAGTPFIGRLERDGTLWKLSVAAD